MSPFIDLLLESTIVQAVVTLVIISGVVVMLVIGKEVPTELWALLTLVTGFWFGSKVPQASRIASKR